MIHDYKNHTILYTEEENDAHFWRAWWWGVFCMAILVAVFWLMPAGSCANDGNGATECFATHSVK